MAGVQDKINSHQDNVEETSFKDNFLHFLHGKNGTVIDICKYHLAIVVLFNVIIVFFSACNHIQRQKDRTFVHPYTYKV